jgi:hypothetical protein
MQYGGVGQQVAGGEQEDQAMLYLLAGVAISVGGVTQHVQYKPINNKTIYIFKRLITIFNIRYKEMKKQNISFISFLILYRCGYFYS